MRGHIGRASRCGATSCALLSSEARPDDQSTPAEVDGGAPPALDINICQPGPRSADAGVCAGVVGEGVRVPRDAAGASTPILIIIRWARWLARSFARSLALARSMAER